MSNHNKSHRHFPKREEKEDESVKSLKAANRRLKSDNERLKSEIATLELAFKKTSKYIKDNADGISIESIIDGVKKGKTLKETTEKECCDKCGSGELKEMDMGMGGRMMLCTACNYRYKINGN